MVYGKLYLLPTPLGDDALHTIPPYVAEIIRNLDVFIVEKAKTARRFGNKGKNCGKAFASRSAAMPGL